MSSPDPAGRCLRVERKGGVVRLVLDRPPVNVLHLSLLAELEEAVVGLAGDDEARVVVLAGADRAFCAGVEVADHLPERLEDTLSRFGAVIRGLLGLPMPVVGAVHGAAMGGGCELALACDVVLARDDLRMGVPEVRLGAIPPAAAALLPRLVGRQRALDLVLSGRGLDAEEALALGLASRVWPEPRFEAAVDDYVRGLAALSRPVLRLAKRAVREGLERPLEEALAGAESVYRRELAPLLDAREGLAAFMEKREPAWSDR